MQKITTFLWFNNQAEEAMNFYTSIFKNSRIVNVSRCGDAGPGPKGSVLVGTFELEGQQFQALNGGPSFSFTPAISMMVSCETQSELDEFWAKLSEGGKPGRCGWLTDKFGLSWQIIPTALGKLMTSGTPEQSGRVMGALMQMDKLEIAALQHAFAGA